MGKRGKVFGVDCLVKRKKNKGKRKGRFKRPFFLLKYYQLDKTEVIFSFLGFATGNLSGIYF